MNEDLEKKEMRKWWERKQRKKKIVILGEGRIVGDENMKDYEKGGFKVKGILDKDMEKERKIEEKWGVKEFD